MRNLILSKSTLPSGFQENLPSHWSIGPSIGPLISCPGCPTESSWGFWNVRLNHEDVIAPGRDTFRHMFNPRFINTRYTEPSTFCTRFNILIISNQDFSGISETYWLDSDLIPRLLKIFEKWKNFMVAAMKKRVFVKNYF